MLMTLKKEIQSLISAGKIELALKKVIEFVNDKDDDDVKTQINTVSGSYNSARKKSNMGIISSSEWAQTQAKTSYTVLELLKEPVFEEGGNGEPPNPPDKGKPVVFISYNHRDSKVANKLNKALTESDIEVIQDVEAMQAGAKISEFILDSVKKSDVTLSLVSNNSLKSGWVATETINTFFLERFSENKKFIAVYIDGDFFNPRFRLDATKEIDAKIDELDKLIAEYKEYKIDTNDLNNEKSRLFELRNNLGTILQNLKNSLCVDISDDNFEDGITKVIKAIIDVRKN